MNTVNIAKEMIKQGVTEIVYLDNIIPHKWTRDDLIKVINFIQKDSSVIANTSIMEGYKSPTKFTFGFGMKVGVIFVEKENNNNFIVYDTEKRHAVTLNKSQVRIIASLPSRNGSPWIFGFRDEL